MSLEWYSFLILYSFSVQNRQNLSSSENILSVGSKMYQWVFRHQQSFPFPDLLFKFRQHFTEREIRKNGLLFNIIYRLALAYLSSSINLPSKPLLKYIRTCASTVAKILHTVQIFCCKKERGEEKKKENKVLLMLGGCGRVFCVSFGVFLICVCFCCYCNLK